VAVAPSFGFPLRFGQADVVYAAKTVGLFVLTAVAEILGCYLPYLWLGHSDRSGTWPQQR
jgi:hypothetical protein